MRRTSSAKTPEDKARNKNARLKAAATKATQSLRTRKRLRRWQGLPRRAAQFTNGNVLAGRRSSRKEEHDVGLDGSGDLRHTENLHWSGRNQVGGQGCLTGRGGYVYGSDGDDGPDAIDLVDECAGTCRSAEVNGHGDGAIRYGHGEGAGRITGGHGARGTLEGRRTSHGMAQALTAAGSFQMAKPSPAGLKAVVVPAKVAEPLVAVSKVEIAVAPLVTMVGSVKFHHLKPAIAVPVTGSAPLELLAEMNGNVSA